MSVYCILDTETASLYKGVVEVAWLWVDANLNVLDEQCHRVNPECRIEPGARAVHGISDEDVAGCPTIVQICAGFRGLKLTLLGTTWRLTCAC
jgi:DNA polymerase III epsilon subunit-like protein